MILCTIICSWFCFFFFKQKTAYEMRISDWSSDVCSSDLSLLHAARQLRRRQAGDVLAEPDLGELGERDLMGLMAVHPLRLDQPEGHILPDRQGIEQIGRAHV